MSCPPEALADALVAAHPDRDPGEVSGDELSAWIDALGADGADGELCAAVAVAWESRLL